MVNNLVVNIEFDLKLLALHQLRLEESEESFVEVVHLVVRGDDDQTFFGVVDYVFVLLHELYFVCLKCNYFFRDLLESE